MIFLKKDDAGSYAGSHFIIDVFNAKNTDDLDLIRSMMQKCAIAANATILHTHCHVFEPNNGVSGVIVLAESHISIHTWPECQYAALDVFMCGTANPEKTIPVIQEMLESNDVKITHLRRGSELAATRT